MGLRAVAATPLAMHNPFDRLAKKVGKKALDPCGATVVQYEIFRDAQHADLRHDPDPARGAERARLGLLGRIAAVLCLIDVFGHALDSAELRACLGKHFAHWEECLRKTRAHNKRRKEKGLPPEPFVDPLLWILAAAVSALMLRKLKVETASGWPSGPARPLQAAAHRAHRDPRVGAQDRGTGRGDSEEKAEEGHHARAERARSEGADRATS